MSRLAELFVQWVQTGIRCSHIPAFVQPPPNTKTNFVSSTANAHVIDEDVAMEASPQTTSEGPSFGLPNFSGNIDDIPEKVWDELQVFSQQLLDRDPRTLSPHEKALLQMLHQRREQFLQDQANFIRDEVMKSPTLVHAQPPQVQPFVTREQNEIRLEDMTSGTTFKSTYYRHHPYMRHVSATPRMDGVSKRIRKKASTGFPVDRETRQQKGRLLKKERQLEEAREEAERARIQMEENTWRLKVEMKKLEVLEWAKAVLWENERAWDESVFRTQHSDFLQEEAERLCREEGVRNRQREENDGRFAHAVSYLDHIFKEQVDRQTVMELSSKEEVQKVDEDELRLAKAIQETRAELKRLEKERIGLPGRRKQWVDQLQVAIETKTQLVGSHSEMLEFLEGAMKENGQDFFEAWKAFQARFCTGPDFWPPGITPPTPTGTHVPPSTSPSSGKSSSTTSGDDDNCSTASSPTNSPPDHPAPTSEVSTPTSPPPALSTSAAFGNAPPQASSTPRNAIRSSPSPTSSTPSNLSIPHTLPPLDKLLPTGRPKETVERITRYREDWELLKSGQLSDGVATFDQVPWPVLFDLRKGHLDDLTVQRVEDFLFHPSRLSGKTPHKILLEELLRWHADKLGVILGKFVPEDRPFIRAAGNHIAALLLQLRDSL